LGATWRSGAGYDELLFVTGSPQTIKRFRVDDAGVSEISSYMVDPNLFVTLPYYCGYNRDILALRVTKQVKGTASGAYLGFSKDNGQTISISEITPPNYLLWIDQCSFYMAHSLREGRKLRMFMSKAQLDIDSMTVQTREILQEDGSILLATQSLNGSLVYVTGRRLFRDNEILAELPEELSAIPFVNGSYLACVSEDKIYILSDKGEVLGTKQKPQGSLFAGLSAATRCVYLTTEGREKIISYNFIEKSENVVFDPNNAP